jgi:hypothetical protein
MAALPKSHKNDKLWGEVAEALVAAYALMGANGKLTSYRPFSDVDGKDIIIDLAGGFHDIYLQVKCALGLTWSRRIAGTVRLHRDHVPADAKFVYVFCLMDRRKMELTRLWVVPAAMFYKRAYRTLLAKGMIQFNFDCRVGGDVRWDEFEVTRPELGPRLVQLIRAATDGRRRLLLAAADTVTGRWLQIAA